MSSTDEHDGPSAGTRSKKKRVLANISNTVKNNEMRRESGRNGKPKAQKRSSDDAAEQTAPESDYSKSWHSLNRRNEVKFQVDASYMKRQPFISAKLRFRLIDCLEEVHIKFQLVPEVLHLAVNLLDRFMCHRPVHSNRVLLLGMTCLLLAAKFEDANHFTITDLVAVNNCSFTRKEVLETESRMCRILQHQLLVPTVYHFLSCYFQVFPASERFIQLACYLGERVLHEYTMLRFMPSAIAATIVRACRKTFQVSPSWNSALLAFSGYEECDLEECAIEIRDILESPFDRFIVHKKYAEAEVYKVALITVTV
jgi:cyclin A